MILFPKRRLKLIYLFLLISGVLSFLYAQEKIDYNPKNRRDPLLPLITADGLLLESEESEKTVSNFRLEGIIYDPQGQSFAMINGLVLKVGDSLGDYKVLKIEARKVRLIKESQITELELKKED